MAIPYINVLDYGVNHNWCDQSGAIQKLIDNAKSDETSTLFFPRGTYRLDAPIKMKSNISLIGEDATFVVIGKMGIYASYYDDNYYIDKNSSPVFLDTLKIKGFRFTIAKEKPAIMMRNVRNVKISDIYSTGGGVWINTVHNVNSNDGTPSPTESAGIRSILDTNMNILIENVTAINENWHNDVTNPDMPYARGIYLEYCNNVDIVNCHIEGQAQGIQIWGGNAEPHLGGSTATRFYSNDVIVTNCIVKHCTGGGIWGSLVKNFTVSNCILDHMLDVGIDFESCHSALASNNVVSNCRFGNFAIYSCCSNVLLADNISKCDTMEYRNTVGQLYCAHFSLYNSANNPFNETITIDGCQFVSTNGYVGGVTFGACRNRIVRNCYFENSILCYNDGTTGHVNSEITGNKFYFNMGVKNLSVITSMSHGHIGYHSIRNNTIQVGDGENGIAKATNVNGIECYEFNAEGRHIVSDNLIQGVNTGIYGRQEGNKTLYIVAKDNIMNAPIKSRGRVNFVKNGNISISGSAKWD